MKTHSNHTQSLRKMAGSRSASGTMLLYMAIFLVILLVIAFFFLNMGALIGTKTEAQTAADAAALTAAREIAAITVDSKLGRIGLVDMDPHDPRNPYFKVRGNDNEAPVIGFNTALATLRLDALIAQDLDNQDMKDLCKRDLDELKDVAKNLNQSVARGIAPGSECFNKAKASYEENNRRMGGLNQLVDNGFALHIGRLRDSVGGTNIPLPASPSRAGSYNDAVVSELSQKGKTTYPANVVLDVADLKFAFAAIKDSPSLAPTSDFVPFGDTAFNLSGFGELPASVVCVDATDKIKAVAPDGHGHREQTTLRTQSCAQAGSERLRTRSTVYTLGFGGFPSKARFSRISIEQLLKFTDWANSGEHQPSTWLKAAQGDFPAASGAAPVPLTPTTFLADKPAVQSPGTALAYGLYDWLRSLRLRPKREEVAKLFRTDLRKKIQNRQLAMDGSSTDGSEEDDASAENEDTSDDDGDLAASDEDESPTMGCMFRPPVGEDPRYSALVSGDEAGTQLYFNAFNYRALDSDICADSSIPIFVDPITGETKGQAGNDIIELCQLVEGSVASNHAGFAALVAGREARLEAIEARRVLRPILKTLGDADKTYNDLRQNPSDSALRSSLVAQLNSVKSQAMNYEQLPLLKTSPVSSNKAVFHRGPAPAEILAELQHASFDHANIEHQADKFLSGRFDLNVAFGEEHQRVEEIRRRAGRVRRNARTAMRKSVRLVRHLRKWSNRGIRRLDIHPSADFYPPAPAFAVNIRRPKAKRPTGGHVPTRVVFIIPNNGNSAVRNDASARPHFFRLDAVSRGEVTSFKQSLEKVEPAVDKGNYDRGDFEGLEQLSSGSSIFPQNKAQVLDVRSQLNPGVRPFARNWDSEGGPGDFRLGVHPSRTGIAFMRLYRRLTVGDRTAKTGPMPASMGSYIKLKEFRRQVSEAQKGQDEDGTGIVESEDEPSDLVPGYEQVFVLSCDGDSSFDRDRGSMNVNYVRQPRTYDARYPFGTNQLLSQQYLYFAGLALEDGRVGPDPNHPKTNYRAVIARDQFADLSQGNSYRLQPDNNWCHSSAGYGLEIGKGSGECPYPAGEWRLGNAYSIACCKLNPEKLAIKSRPRDFEAVLGALSNEGDSDDDDVTLAEPDIDEDAEMCPLLIKRGARTGKILAFF